LVAFLPALPVADIQLPAEPRSTPPKIGNVNGPIGHPVSAPLTAPEGITSQHPEAAPHGSTLPGEPVSSHELPQEAFKTEALPPMRTIVDAPTEIPRVIEPPMRTRSVDPTYPPTARAARVQGVVIIEAIIDVNGKVIDTRILRSIPLLDAAALDAVRQWEYTPTMLNGRPTPVIMTVTINFTLQ
jgi:protein TonB